MMRWLGLMFLILFVPVLSYSQNEDDLKKKVAEVLGEEKWEALNDFLLSFDSFLTENYPTANPTNRPKEFLKHYLSSDSMFFWKDNTQIRLAYDQLETSGLRVEMFTIGDEEYFNPTNYYKFMGYPQVDSTQQVPPVESDFEDILEIPPFESLSNEEQRRILEYEREVDERRKYYLYSNTHGLFLLSLSTVENENQFIRDYLSAKRDGGEIHSALVASGLLQFEDYQLLLWSKRMIMVYEIYYHLLHFEYFEQKGD